MLNCRTGEEREEEEEEETNGHKRVAAKRRRGTAWRLLATVQFTADRRMDRHQRETRDCRLQSQWIDRQEQRKVVCFLHNRAEESPHTRVVIRDDSTRYRTAYVVCQAQMLLERRNYPAKLIIAPCPWQPVSSDFLLCYPRRPPSSFLLFFPLLLLLLLLLLPLSVCLSVCLCASLLTVKSQETCVNLAHQRHDTFSLSQTSFFEYFRGTWKQVDASLSYPRSYPA